VNGEITAAAFNGPGITGIRVRTTVRLTGLGRLRLAEDATRPTIRVTEVVVDDKQTTCSSHIMGEAGPWRAR
jgi:hypothetical protein